ncbi:glycosyltransferase family 2 protein [Humibacillus xanthopallidus]|uniref:GT2 family glycosyltransferase n=1 Tax=Humibacillus xanthopallidus TaxID=412689 RepID=A0A543HZW0_9MICO|nr:glycosyltransferase family 2 protein [Humibacillus xanthopallidus]TQM63881.1 GT2 family glycosyltransferase [Humibacillus xanthopallidus]
MNTLRRSVIVLGFGPEPLLEDALNAIDADCASDDEIILVDNGIQSRAVRQDAWPVRVRVVGDGENSGFAGGCHRGSDAAEGEILVFVNSDAILRRGTLDALTRGTLEPGVAIACGCLLLADQPDLVNSVGNPLHFSGISWAGACGEPAVDHEIEQDVTVATGGLLAMNRDMWNALGGFDEMYFAYNEDTDLSLRAWLRGWRVLYVPDAVAEHHYEFGRSPLKMYLVERNRLVTVLTDYPDRLLRVVLPAMFGMEALLLVQALLQGWSAQKLRSWWWIARHVGVLRDRRARVQAHVTASDADIARLLVSRVEPPMMSLPPGMGVVNGGLEAYWRRARRSLVARAR